MKKWKVFRKPRGARWKRLDAELRAYSADLDGRLKSGAIKTDGVPWLDAAKLLLEEARRACEDDNLQAGWQAYRAAGRMETFGLAEPELMARARSLRKESEKLNKWRRKSVLFALEEMERGSDANMDLPARKTLLYWSTQLRDEHYQNNYFKAAVSWEQLLVLGVILLLALVALAFLLVTGASLELPAAGGFESGRLITCVLLLGTLGAGYSTIRSLLQMPNEARIPDRLAQWSVTLVRPVLGAVAALIAYMVLRADFFNLDEPGVFVVLLSAFAAGFSDRLVLRAVESVTGRGE